MPKILGHKWITAEKFTGNHDAAVFTVPVVHCKKQNKPEHPDRHFGDGPQVNTTNTYNDQFAAVVLPGHFFPGTGIASLIPSAISASFM